VSNGTPPTTGWWWARVPAQDSLPARLVFVYSDAHPDGTEVAMTAAQADAELSRGHVATVLLDGPDVPIGVEIAPSLAPDAPPLWFAEIRESTGRPPAANLVAFTGHGIAQGRLLDEAALREVDVSSDDQVAAVRWYPATGEVDQVYVQPQWRRRGIAQVLLHAAATIAVARGWKRFWGDGQRTAMGEQMRNASYWRHRGADLTVLAPPMTPGERERLGQVDPAEHR